MKLKMSEKTECLVSCLSYSAEDVSVVILLSQKLTVRLYAD